MVPETTLATTLSLFSHYYFKTTCFYFSPTFISDTFPENYSQDVDTTDLDKEPDILSFPEVCFT